MRVTRAGALVVGALTLLPGCSGRIVQLGADGGVAGGSGAAGAGDGSAGTPCLTPEGVRLCGGDQNQCGWLGTNECPGVGCLRPYDDHVAGAAKAGVCFADLPDNGSRACSGCEDGEVCIQRKQGQYVCVPESVCADLWSLGVRGVCRYADLTAYDGTPLSHLSSCPDQDGSLGLCGGPCPSPCLPPPYHDYSCTGRSPDHPQGLCFWSRDSCALADSGYAAPCPYISPGYDCGVFRDPGADYSVARKYGVCVDVDRCLELAKRLPGGFDCYDYDGKLVTP